MKHEKPAFAYIIEGIMKKEIKLEKCSWVAQW